MNELQIANACSQIIATLAGLTNQVTDLRDLVCGGSEGWHFPVGSTKFPIEEWYCAQFHTYDPDANPAGHTGLDLNGDRHPWGDVDRDEPTFAIADGVVHDAGCSPGWVGVVVLRIEHNGLPLWVRYAHLDWQSVTVEPGDVVRAGDPLGVIGNYSKGDHLHFDMARDPFGWNYWRTRYVRWVDPVPVLKAHLSEAMIDAMLARG